jgi:hypothetical protein
MLYDSFDFKPYVCFDFQNLSIYDLYMYYYWPICQNPLIIAFRVVSNFFETTTAVCTGHVPPFGPDMSGSWPEHVRVSGFLGI